MCKFSIIIPTYNRADRLISAIDSVLNQTESDWELIIVDDGSTDDTAGQVAKYKDPRIKYFYKENEERAIARNFGINRALGDYITFLDSDDMYYSHYLSEALDLIALNPQAIWFHLAYEIQDEKGKILRQENNRKGDINETLVTGNHLSCIGVFVKAEVLAHHQFEEDPVIIGSEDYILWMRLSARHPLFYSNRICATMIQHSGRSVININEEKLEKRILQSMRIIQGDEAFQKIFGQAIGRFKAHRYIYLALHLALSKNRLKALKYLCLALKNSMKMIVSRKFVGVLMVFAR
jgi:glycosyltransferase involved in cell wall biosynthesis